MVLKRHKIFHIINMDMATDTAISTNTTMVMAMVMVLKSHPKSSLGDDVFHKQAPKHLILFYSILFLEVFLTD